MTWSSAGVRTNSGSPIITPARPIRPAVRSGRWLPETPTRAGCAPTGALPVGGMTIGEKPRPRGGLFVSVSPGGDHSCGLRLDGAAECWGGDSGGEADSPSNPKYTVPMPEAGPDNPLVEVSTGDRFACGLHKDGALECWGVDDYGTTAAPEGTYRSVSAGWHHSCAIATDDQAVCWGRDFNGEATPPGGTFRSVSAGHRHTCGIASDGTVACWGQHFSPPQLPSHCRTDYSGEITEEQSYACDLTMSRRPRYESPGGRFSVISAGRGFTCGVREDGSIACWGGGFRIVGSAPAGAFQHVSAGAHHACVLQNNGSVVCWGSDTSQNQDVPAGKFQTVSAGNTHSCGVLLDGAVECWGHHYIGGRTPPDGMFRSVSSGRYTGYTCGLKDDGTVECWGGFP